jgi:hypothetical protein
MRKAMLKRFLFICLLTITASSVQAQAPSAASITATDVISMSQAGLSDDIIIAKIHQSNAPANLSTDDLIKLKKANVSDAVIKALLNPQAAAAPSTTIVVQTPGLARLTNDNPSGAATIAGQSAAGDPNDPLAVHDSGIYLYQTNADGSPHMIMLERTAATFKMTTGFGTVKTKAEIPGKAASLRTTPKGVFYFYFEDKSAGLSNAPMLFGSVSNPSQFILVRLTVQKSSRESVVGSFSGWTGTGGSTDKGVVAFKSERIRSGLYKVELPADIAPGEYYFISSPGSAGIYGASMGTSSIFDFGVD